MNKYMVWVGMKLLDIVCVEIDAKQGNGRENWKLMLVSGWYMLLNIKIKTNR